MPNLNGSPEHLDLLRVSCPKSQSKNIPGYCEDEQGTVAPQIGQLFWGCAAVAGEWMSLNKASPVNPIGALHLGPFLKHHLESCCLWRSGCWMSAS
jgi:hypothetical protein